MNTLSQYSFRFFITLGLLFALLGCLQEPGFMNVDSPSKSPALARIGQANPYSSPANLFEGWRVSVSGKLTKPINTSLVVNAGDFVYIQVQGKVTFGRSAGDSYGTGVTLPGWFSSYNKYPKFNHGALVVGVGNQVVACGRMFMAASNPVYFALADPKYMVGGPGFTYVPGINLIAQSSGPIQLDINDGLVSDNSGAFSVEIYIVRRNNHNQRNYFNICPNQEPDDKAPCTKKDGWVKEGPKSIYYHGFNNSYRGSGKYAGCQCIYDRGRLLIDHKNQGSFDIAFGIGIGNETNKTARHLHLVVDVLPHDLYEAQFGGNPYIGHSTYVCK